MDHLDDAKCSNGESPFATSSVPHLRIIHLMLWTLCSAAYLAIMRAILASQHEMPSRFATMQYLTSALQSGVVGATWTGAIVLVHARLSNRVAILRHPGHWILLITAVASAIWLLVLCQSLDLG